MLYGWIAVHNAPSIFACVTGIGVETRNRDIIEKDFSFDISGTGFKRRANWEPEKGRRKATERFLICCFEDAHRRDFSSTNDPLGQPPEESLVHSDIEQHFASCGAIVLWQEPGGFVFMSPVTGTATPLNQRWALSCNNNEQQHRRVSLSIGNYNAYVAEHQRLALNKLVELRRNVKGWGNQRGGGPAYHPSTAPAARGAGWRQLPGSTLEAGISRQCPVHASSKSSGSATKGERGSKAHG